MAYWQGRVDLAWMTSTQGCLGTTLDTLSDENRPDLGGAAGRKKSPCPQSRRLLIDVPPRQRGYLRSLFDLRFVDLVTPKLIRGLYSVVVVWTLFMTVLWVWTGLALPAWMGWGTRFFLVVGTPLAALVWLSLFRMFLEYMIIHFALRDEMRAVRMNLEKINGLPSEPALGPPGPWLAAPPRRTEHG